MERVVDVERVVAVAVVLGEDLLQHRPHGHPVAGLPLPVP